MIVDFHTHTFPDAIASRAISKLSAAGHIKPFTDGTEDGLRRSMKEAGIGLSVILPVATNPAKVIAVNDASAHLDGSAGLLSFASMHPDFPGWKEELARVKQMGFRGIKLHPVYQGVDFNDVRYLRILDRAAEVGLCVVTHAGKDVGFPGVEHISPAMIVSALNKTDGGTLILAHMGGWRDWDTAEETRGHENVYVDTSFSLGQLTPTDHTHDKDLDRLDEDGFMRLVRCFGADRVLFGSDSPWDGQKETLERLCALPLTDKEKDAIFSRNAARLLSLHKETT